jgi:DNA topoisomerase-1
MKLIIIESPGKIHSYKKALGSGYEVHASYGHCVDLPPKKLSVDIKNNFQTNFEVLPDKKDVIKGLKEKAKKATEVYLMSDPDREGEAIAKNIYDQIKSVTKAPIHRAVTHEITKKGIDDALKNLTCIDENKYNAYLARRILDRLAGYKTSFLVKQSTGGASAGRVQSAILRILVDREKEIQIFVPEEYWTLTAYLLSQKKEAFIATLVDTVKVNDEKTASKIYESVYKSIPTVFSVERKEVNVNPQPPFTTLPMGATASTIFGWNIDKTMKVAQNLYEAAHITYHRTDSPALSADALSAIRHLIGSTYGGDYLPSKPNFYAAKKGAQEAHEACRPTDVSAHLNLQGDEAKLYGLIWKRAIASQMNSGRDEKLKVITKIAEYDFVSRGSRVLFDGYRKCWSYGAGQDVLLPELKNGETCSWDTSKHTTQEFQEGDQSWSES